MTSQVFAKLFFLQALSSSPPAFPSPSLKRDQKRETRKQKWVLTSSPGSPPAVSAFLFGGWPSALPSPPGTAVWRRAVPLWRPAPVGSSPGRSSAPLSERHTQRAVIAPAFKHKALLASLCSDIDTKESEPPLNGTLTLFVPGSKQMSKFLQDPHSTGLSNNLYRNPLLYLLGVEGDLTQFQRCLAKI